MGYDLINTTLLVYSVSKPSLFLEQDLGLKNTVELEYGNFYDITDYTYGHDISVSRDGGPSTYRLL